MDDILLALSSLLINAGTDGYKIFYEDELTEVFPDDLRNRETLEAALKKLANEGCVDVKYVRGDVFCIATLKAYEPPEEVVEQQTDTQQELYSKRANVFIALAAFLGAALGGCVTAIIAAVV